MDSRKCLFTVVVDLVGSPHSLAVQISVRLGYRLSSVPATRVNVSTTFQRARDIIFSFRTVKVSSGIQ
jgi:hypothetical protein